jgi:hypothetical protein
MEENSCRMQYAFTPYRRCRTIRASRASRCTPRCSRPLTRKDKERLQAQSSQRAGTIHIGRATLPFCSYFVSWQLISQSIRYFHIRSLARKLARVIRVTSCSRSPARLSCPEPPLTPSQVRPFARVWSGHFARCCIPRSAPVKVEYVPAMQAVHADDPAGPPCRRKAAVSLINVMNLSVQARLLPSPPFVYLKRL